MTRQDAIQELMWKALEVVADFEREPMELAPLLEVLHDQLLEMTSLIAEGGDVPERTRRAFQQRVRALALTAMATYAQAPGLADTPPSPLPPGTTVH